MEAIRNVPTYYEQWYDSLPKDHMVRRTPLEVAWLWSQLYDEALESYSLLSKQDIGSRVQSLLLGIVDRFTALVRDLSGLQNVAKQKIKVFELAMDLAHELILGSDSSHLRGNLVGKGLKESMVDMLSHKVASAIDTRDAETLRLVSDALRNLGEEFPDDRNEAIRTIREVTGFDDDKVAIVLSIFESTVKIGLNLKK